MARRAQRRLRIVTDANIWIQLDHGGLVLEAFLLPYDFVTPDVVVAELGCTLETQIRGLGLTVVVSSPEDELEAQKLRRKHPKPGNADLHALLHARLMSAPLVTGDAHLRDAAETDGVAVSGILWLLAELIEHSLIHQLRAAESLEGMRSQGARLPADECEAHLRRWMD